jgi:preprotein translocase SecE subunit
VDIGDIVLKPRADAKTKTAARMNFFSDTINELKKVTWLSRREVVYLSSIVLIVTIVVGVFLALVDFGFTQLIEKVFIRG